MVGIKRLRYGDEPVRLLIYSQDGLGLGHLQRTRSIAREVLALAPESAVLIVADSPAGPFFAPLPGLDYLKIPTVIKTGPSWRTHTLPLDVRGVFRLRSKILLEAFNEFRPDAVLVDHMPVGALGELKPTLDRARQRPCRLFLGLRDVLDAPQVICQTWSECDAYTYLAYYQEVFVYGCRRIYDADIAYQLSPFAQRIRYCNYVCSQPEHDPPTRAPEEPFVLVMGGGGHDALGVAKTFLQAAPLLARQERFRATLLTGPTMSPLDRQALAAQWGFPAVQIASHAEDISALLARASVVVCMAGYNSLCEVLAWRKKALVIPRAGPSAEQRMRSRLFAERHLIRLLNPDDLTPERLAEDLLQLLGEEGLPDLASIPPLDGAQRAAAVLVQSATPDRLYATGGQTFRAASLKRVP